MRIGSGLQSQLGTVRFLGIFLPRPTEVPDGVVRFVATQLGIRDTTSFARYAQRTATHREHASQIQKRYGYRPSSDPAESFQLLRWLYTRATLSAERPSVLFDRATARLVEHKVLLSGVTVLKRLVSSVRNRAVKRLWRLLSAMPTPEQRATLDAMLLVPEGSRRSNLDRLRRSPTTISARALRQALERLSEIEKLGALGLVVNAIVLWNTRYMDAVLSQLQADGDAIEDADVRRLSPLVHKHLNFLGRYHFSLAGDIRGGVLRELRDPNAGLEEEWLLPVGSP